MCPLRPWTGTRCILGRVGQNLLAHDLKRTDQKTPGATGRIADSLTLSRIHHVHHELDDTARSEELPDLAPECPTQKPLERDALDVLTGIRKVVLLQSAYKFPRLSRASD